MFNLNGKYIKLLSFMLMLYIIYSSLELQNIVSVAGKQPGAIFSISPELKKVVSHLISKDDLEK